MGWLDSVTRGLEGVATGGLSEFVKSDPFGVPGGGQYLPLIAGGAAGAMMGNPALGFSLGSTLYSAEQQARAVGAANATNAAVADKQMAFSAAQAREQMAFQERMSDTAVQRQVAGLKDAGINPMLAAGSSASTPSGASGTSAGYTAQVVPPVSASFLNSASQVLNTLQGLKESDSRIASNRASAKLSVASADTKATEGWISTGLRDMLKSFVGSARQLYRSSVNDVQRGQVFQDTPTGKAELHWAQ